MEKIKLDRINELAHKSKTEGLTDEEKEEQKILRQEFIAEIRADVKASLESIEIVDEVEAAAEEKNEERSLLS
jgi:uncharacterized protein YnzC (UPF0291/DUF896 family)